MASLARQDDELQVLEETDRPSPAMDLKDYGIGAQILRSIGVREIRLITNNLSKRVGLKGYGLEIVEEVALFDEGTAAEKSTNADGSVIEKMKNRDQ